MNRNSILLIAFIIAGCSSATVRNDNREQDQPSTVYANRNGKGQEISIQLFKGKSFYYPLMAAWLEDGEGNYIQTLYVAESVAKGTFKFGKEEGGNWVAGPKRAPQTLPYWAHKRGVKAADGLYVPDPENPVADAYTGATPTDNFILITKADKELPRNFRVMFEINQNWDWNEYWTNDKYPGDKYYLMSCQPALVYEALIDINTLSKPVKMRPAGHSHYSGMTGELFADLSTLTTALQIADSVVVTVR